MNPISYLVDRLLTYLELKRADRFAREQALGNVEIVTFQLPELGKPIEVLPPPGEGMAWVQDKDGTWLRIYVSTCTSDGCNKPKPHSPCHFQTALAAKRDRERKR